MADAPIKRFPIARTRLSNERIMAALFVALAAWQVPLWLADDGFPGRFWGYLARFAAVVASSLAVDAVLGAIRHKRAVCAVSAGITAGVVVALCPAAPTWALCLASCLALAIGKHAFGGTGKNPLNPAMLAVLAVSLAVPGSAFVVPGVTPGVSPGSAFAGTLALIPAALVSLPFIAMRPFASAGFLAGSLGAALVPLALAGGLGPEALVSAALPSGMLFYASVVVTDPTTVTRRPFAGAACAFAAGLSWAAFRSVPFAMPLSVLALNVASRAVDAVLDRAAVRELNARMRPGRGTRIKKAASRTLDPLGDEPLRGDGTVPRRDDILALIEAANVVGHGGAGYPAAEKIHAVARSAPEGRILIVNAVECDPGLVHDAWLLAARGREIARGIGYVMTAAGIDRAVIAAKGGSEAAALAIAGFQKGASVTVVPDRYPEGSERALVARVTGRGIARGEIPARSGVLVLNAQTLYAVCRAVEFGERDDAKYVTALDLANGEARPVLVFRGERVMDVANRALPGTLPVFVGGGLMQGYRAGDGDLIRDDVNLVARGPSPRYRESPFCSRCGECARVCPASLDPARIAGLVDAGKANEALALGAADCLRCGSCSYHCLAGKNLSARVAVARAVNAASVP